MTPDERPTAKPIHLQQEMVKHLLNIIQNVLTGTSPPPPPPILLIFTLYMSFIKLLRMHVYCLESKIDLRFRDNFSQFPQSRYIQARCNRYWVGDVLTMYLFYIII